MNHYETNIIIRPNLAKSEAKKLVDKVVKMVKKNKGNIVYQHPLEMKPLAYPIQKHEKGYYQILEFQAEPNFIVPLQVFYKREENIIRYMTIALDKHGVAYNEKKRNHVEKNTTKQESSNKDKIAAEAEEQDPEKETVNS